MKRILSVSMSALLVMSLAGCSSSSSGLAASSASEASSSGKTYNITVVKQMDHASLDQIADAITAELDKIAVDNDITINYGEVQSGQNDQTTIKQITDQAVADGVDAIIPIATLAAQTAVVSASESGTPVIYAAISDPDAAELTGLTHVTGTSDALNTKQIIDMMLSVNPDLSKVGLLYSLSEANSTKAIQEAKDYLDEKGIEYVEATGNTNDEVITAASSLAAEGVGAVFTPTDNVVMAAAASVGSTFADAGIPFYAGADSFVTAGAFATCGVNYVDLGTKTADLAYQAITEGFDGLDDYYVMDGGIVTVNTETAEKIGADYSSFSNYGEVVEVTTTE